MTNRSHRRLRTHNAHNGRYRNLKNPPVILLNVDTEDQSVSTRTRKTRSFRFLRSKPLQRRRCRSGVCNDQFHIPFKHQITRTHSLSIRSSIKGTSPARSSPSSSPSSSASPPSSLSPTSRPLLTQRDTWGRDLLFPSHGGGSSSGTCCVVFERMEKGSKSEGHHNHTPQSGKMNK